MIKNWKYLWGGLFTLAHLGVPHAPLLSPCVTLAPPLTLWCHLGTTWCYSVLLFGVTWGLLGVTRGIHGVTLVSQGDYMVLLWCHKGTTWCYFGVTRGLHGVKVSLLHIKHFYFFFLIVTLYDTLVIYWWHLGDLLMTPWWSTSIPSLVILVSPWF